MTNTPSSPRADDRARGTGRARLKRASAFAALALAMAFGAACTDMESIDPQRDNGNPTIELTPGTAPDSSIAFSVLVNDQIGIKYIDVTVTGGVNAVFSDTLRTNHLTFTRSYNVTVPPSVPPGTNVIVTAQATDGAGNRSAVDTLLMATGNVAAAGIVITSPMSGTQAVSGKSLVLSISARSPLKLRYVGYQVTGAFTAADSTSVATVPMRDSVLILDSLAVPANVTGTATVTPFIVDSLGQRSLGSSIILTVVSAAQVVTTPVITFEIAPRIEVQDVIYVEGTDLAGIRTLGYEMRDSSGVMVDRDSAMFDGSFTTVPHTFQLSLPVTQFPMRLFVRAFGTNTNGVRAYAGGTTVRTDTVTVVAGVTRPLPTGGTVADAYYHRRLDRLYLTNVTRNRLEVFNLPDSTFREGIPVGARPWGITPWPRTRGSNAVGDDPGDTLLVANSGGTNISYVDLTVAPTGRDVYRYPLPNVLVYGVKTKRDPNTGLLIPERTLYDFSDRPQFIAATCTGSAAPGAACGDVMLVYSTTPTGGQSTPYQNRGTLRRENLTNKSSHFFWEHAYWLTSDTIEIERKAARDQYGALVGSDSMLVPFCQPGRDAGGTIVGRYCFSFDVTKLPFRDTTHARNSGDFRRAVMAEGGDVLGSRAMTYDATIGMAPGPNFSATPSVFLETPVFDRGASEPIQVSDFVANTFQSIRGVGINFDGELSAIRGDSTYIVSSLLRLQGLLATAGNSGFDFHPLNTGQNSTPLNTRLAFAASGEPQIEVYDTYCYQRVGLVPVRDPIIGPIKSTLRNGRLMLFGATSRGVVIVSVDNTFTTTCP